MIHKLIERKFYLYLFQILKKIKEKIQMRKKTKLIYLMIAIILFSANLINASWLDKLSDSVNKVTKSVQKTVEKVDPKKYILQAMNSNPELYRYNRDIKNKMNEINRLLKQSTSPIKQNQKEKPFKYTSSNVKMKSIMPFIGRKDFSNVKLLKTRVKVGNKNYKIYSFKNYLLPVETSSNSIPVGSNLNAVLKSAYYKKNSNLVNSDYFRNVETLANSIAQINKVGIQLSGSFLDGVDDIKQYQYAGYSALSIVDPLLQASSGLSVSDIVMIVESYKKSSKEVYDFSNSMKKNATSVKTGLRNIYNKSSITSSNVDKIEKGMGNLAKQINEVADEVGNTSRTLSSFSNDLNRLQSFTDIEYFGIIANLLRELKTFTNNLEKGLDSYAGGFRDYVNYNNNNISKTVQSSKSFLQTEFDNYTANTMKKSNALNQSLNLFLQNQYSNTILKSKHSKYLSYLKDIVSSENEIKKLKQEDLYASYSAYTKLQKKVADYPIELSKKFFVDIETEIAKKQLIGKPNTSSFNTTNSSLHKGDDIDFNAVLKLANQTNIVTAAVKKANLMTYILFSVILAVIALFVVLKIMKSKKQTVSVA